MYVILHGITLKFGHKEDCISRIAHLYTNYLVLFDFLRIEI